MPRRRLCCCIFRATEATALQGVAYRLAGRRLDRDAEKMEFTNESDANRFVRREYHRGWEM